MHRFHLPAEHWESSTLPPDESHHCVNVLRLKANERVTVFDGSGREAAAIIVDNPLVTFAKEENFNVSVVPTLAIQYCEQRYLTNDGNFCERFNEWWEDNWDPLGAESVYNIRKQLSINGKVL